MDPRYAVACLLVPKRVTRRNAAVFVRRQQDAADGLDGTVRGKVCIVDGYTEVAGSWSQRRGALLLCIWRCWQGWRLLLLDREADRAPEVSASLRDG